MSRKPLTTQEEAQILHLKEVGILVDIMEQKISPYTIVVACGDGHEYPDIFDHHRSLCRANGHEDNGHLMIHHHLANGGPLVLAANSPLNHKLPGDEVLLAQMGDSFEIKETHHVLLRLHAPCGAARLIGMGPNEQVEALADIQARIMQAYPVVRISRLFDVRYPDGRQRSYFINL